VDAADSRLEGGPGSVCHQVRRPVRAVTKKGLIRGMSRWDCKKKDMALHLMEKSEG
jgi:hypothetical protein